MHLLLCCKSPFRKACFAVVYFRDRPRGVHIAIFIGHLRSVHVDVPGIISEVYTLFHGSSQKCTHGRFRSVHIAAFHGHLRSVHIAVFQG